MSHTSTLPREKTLVLTTNARLTCRAVLLDLDGTLVDTTVAVEDAWRDLADELGIPWSLVQTFAHGIPADQVLAEIAPHLSPAQRARHAAAVLEATASSSAAATWLPGAEQLTRSLTGTPWAIVTSGNRRLAGSSIAKVGVPRPPVLVTADDVSIGKPDPEPFLEAARRLEAPPGDCLVVEDSPAGVIAARAAGMRVVAVTHTHPADRLTSATLTKPRLPRIEGVWNGRISVVIETDS